jgi:CheY-like chemotaxis protein
MVELDSLSIVLVDDEDAGAVVVSALLQDHDLVSRVIRIEDDGRVLQPFETGEANVLMIDIFSVGVERGIAIIAELRERYSHVPVCLLASHAQLATFPGVEDEHWRVRFRHYYRLAKDEVPRRLRHSADAVVRRCISYLLARNAQARVMRVKEHIERTGGSASDASLEEDVEVIERALEARAPNLVTELSLAPGLGDEDLQALVKSTLDGAATSLRRTAIANIAVLGIGASLVLGSSVVAVVMESWEAVTFGGFGLVGVVTSLVSNPLRSIAAGARRLVQVQAAYLGFLNQLSLLGGSGPPENEKELIARSVQLDKATTSLLESLNKNFD